MELSPPRNSKIVGFQEFVGPKMGAEPPLDYFYPPPRGKIPENSHDFSTFFFKERQKLMYVLYTVYICPA